MGAGSGRDAAWLVSLGYDVVAAEPAHGMRREGQRRHADPRLRWIDDRLPELGAVHRLGLAFDLILLSGVWMHVRPPDRPRAFRKLATLLKPGGMLLMTVRNAGGEPDRPMWETSAGEIEGWRGATAYRSSGSWLVTTSWGVPTSNGPRSRSSFPTTEAAPCPFCAA